MTEEQILQLAENHLIFEKHNDVWKTDTLQLLKFALLIHENGYNKGYDDSKSSSFKGFHTCLDD